VPVAADDEIRVTRGCRLEHPVVGGAVLDVVDRLVTPATE